jgi:hypothetical protein
VIEVKNKRANLISSPRTNLRLYIVREALLGLKKYYNSPHDEFVTLVDQVINEFLGESLDIFEQDFIQLQDENDYLKGKLHS